MIKLIASDIDGTLVNSQKQLPPDFEQTINRLSEKGIAFAVSSGRSLIALKEQFGKYFNDISIVCDNGAVILDKGKVLSKSVIPTEKIHKIIDICEENGMLPILCNPENTFIASDNAALIKEVSLYYKNMTVLGSLHDIAEEITKIAIYQEAGIENNGLKILQREFGGDFTVVLSGYYWADVMNANISKGKGIEILQQRLGASYESTMAFGDYLNDIEMLECAYYSYAMENAHLSVKTAANFQTGSNEDFCVTKEINKLIFGE
jgi:hypothetical protein